MPHFFTNKNEIVNKNKFCSNLFLSLSTAMDKEQQDEGKNTVYKTNSRKLNLLPCKGLKFRKWRNQKLIFLRFLLSAIFLRFFVYEFLSLVDKNEGKSEIVIAVAAENIMFKHTGNKGKGCNGQWCLVSFTILYGNGFHGCGENVSVSWGSIFQWWFFILISEGWRTWPLRFMRIEKIEISPLVWNGIIATESWNRKGWWWWFFIFI